MTRTEISELTEDELAFIDAHARIARGVAWLDEHFPGGWRGRVDVDSFRFDNCGKCVAGQLAPYVESEGMMNKNRSYYRFIKTYLDQDHDKARYLGFGVKSQNIPECNEKRTELINIECNLMQREWDRELREPGHQARQLSGQAPG